MPFESKAQERWMWANHPQMAREWQSKTSNLQSLPEHVKHNALQGAGAMVGSMSSQFNPKGKK